MYDDRPLPLMCVDQRSQALLGLFADVLDPHSQHSENHRCRDRAYTAKAKPQERFLLNSSNSFLMRGFKTLCNLQANVDGLSKWNRSFFQSVGQRPAPD